MWCSLWGTQKWLTLFICVSRFGSGVVYTSWRLYQVDFIKAHSLPWTRTWLSPLSVSPSLLSVMWGWPVNHRSCFMEPFLVNYSQINLSPALCFSRQEQYFVTALRKHVWESMFEKACGTTLQTWRTLSTFLVKGIFFFFRPPKVAFSQ